MNSHILCCVSQILGCVSIIVLCFANFVLCFDKFVLCFTNSDLSFKNTVLCFKNCLLCLQIWTTIRGVPQHHSKLYFNSFGYTAYFMETKSQDLKPMKMFIF